MKRAKIRPSLYAKLLQQIDREALWDELHARFLRDISLIQVILAKKRKKRHG